MPSIDQTEDDSDTMAALPASLEVFDKFKSPSDSGNNSDSEESFHLVLEDDDTAGANQVTTLPNRREKDETEDDILNKFNSSLDEVSGNVDPQDEDTILGDAEYGAATKQGEVNEQDDNSLSNTEVKITCNFDDHYEGSGDGEFKSHYEVDAAPDETILMDVGDQVAGSSQESKTTDENVNMDKVEEPSNQESDEVGSSLENPAEKVESVTEGEKSALEPSSHSEKATEAAEEEESVSEPNSLPAEEIIDITEEVKDAAAQGETPPEPVSHADGANEDDLVPELSPVEEPKPEAVDSITDKKNVAIRSDTNDTSDKIKVTIKAKETNNKTTEKKVFKTPEDSKSHERDANDKSEDDDADLLDVSMIRETEEDDACARADALEDIEEEKNAQVNEKSEDEDQSDRMDTEQESREESNDDNDNSVGFDDMETEDSSAGVPLEDKGSSKKNHPVEDSEPTKSAECEVEQGVNPKEASEVEPVSSEVQPCEIPSGPWEPLKSDNSDISDQTVKVSENEDKEVSDKKICSITVDGAKEEPIVNGEISKLLSKRCHTPSKPDQIEEDSSLAKKPRLSIDLDAEIPSTRIPIGNPPSSPKIETLTAFAKFMQCRKLTSKLSRSDLEQFCIQKICESLMLKSSEGELHQSVRKHEKTIEVLRKDVLQLTKQCKDLEIVNKKLMSELRNQNGTKKPLVPLKITRSVGLQVRLNPGNELVSQVRRRQPVPVTPPKAVLGNRGKVVTPVVRQVIPGSPQKLNAGQQTPAASPMLTQALQNKRPVVAKRTTPVRKPGEASPASKPGAPGVIDLTDEDDKLNRSLSVGSTIKIIKTASAAATPTTTTPNKTATVKVSPATKTVAAQQGKQTVAVTKGAPAGPNKANNTLSPGIRLTPGSVITTSANGSPQMVYVVPTLASNASGQQKVAFVNFQPSNGVLSGTLNGSTVIANKPGQTLTLKTVALRQKHPAPLPATQRVARDPKLKPLLPKPHLTIKKIDTGIILQWKMPYNLDLYENIASYQLYAYQETSAPPSTDMWRKVGDVKALALPMACTLTQFADKNKYYFAVRSVDVHKRIGAFSDPEEISL